MITLKENMEIRKIILWCIMLIAVVFVTGRAHYFSAKIPKYYLFSFDARWWWNYQTYFENKDVFSEKISSIESIRFPSDNIATKLFVKAHQKLGFSRIVTNHLASTLIYLITFIFIYFLGLSVMNEPKASFFYGLLVSQSNYMAWLRYPVFVPKMFGFMAFPLLLAAFIRIIIKHKGYFLFGSIFMVTFMLYPASIAYYTPPLFVSGMIYYAFLLKKNEKIGLEIVRYLCVFLLIGIFIISLRYLMKNTSPPPIYITEYYYQNHHFTFSKTFLEYIKSYLDYFILCLASLILILKVAEDHMRRKAFLIFSIYSLCLFGAMVYHMLAVHVDVIRMMWLWRLAYYSYIPCLLVISLGIYQLHISMSKRSWNAKIFVWGMTISLLFWVVYRTPELTTTAKGTIKIYKEIKNGTIVDEYERHMSGLWAFAKQTPKDSLFLMPNRRYQNSYTDVFESEAKRTCILSRNKMYLMIVENKLTKPYYQLLKEYDRIDKLKKNKDYEEQLIHFGKKIGTSYILLPRNHRFKLSIKPVYQDSFWLVYQI